MSGVVKIEPATIEVDDESDDNADQVYLTPTENHANFARLCHLICTICSDVFRDILDKFIDPNILTFELSSKRFQIFPHLNKEQKRLVYPTAHSASSTLRGRDMDISLLYAILRNGCNIPAHTRGWGNTPLGTDDSLAASIDRIRIERNMIQAHFPTSEISQPSFEAHWDAIKTAIVNIEKTTLNGTKYQEAVDRLRHADLNPSLTSLFVQEIKKMQETEEDIRGLFFLFPTFSELSISVVSVSTAKHSGT